MLQNIIFGAGIMILNMLFKSAFPPILQSPINCGVIAMLGGLIMVPIVSWITPKLQKEKIEEMFECYNEEVTVKATESLGN